ncbi:3-phosphoglycerate dehydrogenase [Paraburkholderia sediminicola]|uniref:3-phosphoglycerate dehydrogenase n=1 Tax=Paraburkholderia sediminicola TaxID=458836 RepID=UPI0038BB7E90
MNTTILDDYFDTLRGLPCFHKLDGHPEVLSSLVPGGSVGMEAGMHDPIEPLILDLLEWIGQGARPYSETIEVWRTSCPRLPVWEDACACGYLTRTHLPGGVAEVALSQAGAAYLSASRSMPGADPHSAD